MEELDMIIDDTNERMDKSIQFLVSELKKIRKECLGFFIFFLNLPCYIFLKKENKYLDR